MSSKGHKKDHPPEDGAKTSHGPRQIHALEYAAARQKEIFKLERRLTSSVISASVAIALESEAARGKRAFQLLPRHLRRRCMSYNAKRIHRYLRPLNARQTAGAPPKPPDKSLRSRKHKRRPKYLLNEYERRQRDYVWLETHLWHAKRFKFASQWGFKVPKHPSDKGARAFHRNVSYVCAGMDLSYYRCFELSGPPDSITQLLRELIHEDDRDCFRDDVVQGRCSHRTVLFHPAESGQPRRVIGAVEILWQFGEEVSQWGGDVVSGGDARFVWVWSHPCVAKIVESTFTQQCERVSSVRCEARGDELLRFGILGPRAHAVLECALKECGEQESSSSRAWRQLQGMHSTASLPSRLVLALTVQDPRFSFPPTSSKKHVSDMRQSDTSVLVSRHLTEFTEEWGESSIAKGDIWSKERREEMKNELRKCEVDAARYGRTSSSMSATTAVEVEPKSISILLIQEPGVDGYGAGWSVVVPAGWGMAFWMSFIYAGVRAAGSEQLHSMHTEQSLPFAPFDEPDSPAYAADADRVEAEETESYLRRPPGKRPNYARMNCSSPFRIPWESLFRVGPRTFPTNLYYCGGAEPDNNHDAKDAVPSEETPIIVLRSQREILEAFETVASNRAMTSDVLVRVSIEMRGRGVPQPRSAICMPSDASDCDDPPVEPVVRGLPRYCTLKKRRKAQNAKAKKAARRADGEAEESCMTDSSPVAQPLISSPITLPPPIRREIGFVTSGNASFHRGRGHGIGYCALEAVYHAVTEVGFVLVRNIDSTVYYAADIKVLSDF